MDFLNSERTNDNVAMKRWTAILLCIPLVLEAFAADPAQSPVTTAQDRATIAGVAEQYAGRYCLDARTWGANALRAVGRGDHAASTQWAELVLQCPASPAWADGCYAMASARMAQHGPKDPAARQWLERGLEHSPRL